MSVSVAILHNREAVGETISECLRLSYSFSVSVYGSDKAFTESYKGANILLMDIAYFDLLEKTRIEQGDCKLILLVVGERDFRIARALQAGAVSFVNLRKGPAGILKSIFLALNNRTEEVAEAVRSIYEEGRETSDRAIGTYRFTSKEKLILTYLRKGHHLKLIAQETGTSYQTIRTQLKQIYRKLGVVSMVEAIVKSYTLGF